MNSDPVAAAIREAEHAEAETRYRLQLARESYEAGRRAGYAQAEADMARRWDQIARSVVTGVPYAELEQRRYGPGGRAHFADPRPGDFPGRGAKPQPQPQPQREAAPEPEATA